MVQARKEVSGAEAGTEAKLVLLLSTKECSKVEIGLFLVPALSYQAYSPALELSILLSMKFLVFQLGLGLGSGLFRRVMVGIFQFG